MPIPQFSPFIFPSAFNVLDANRPSRNDEFRSAKPMGSQCRERSTSYCPAWSGDPEIDSPSEKSPLQVIFSSYISYLFASVIWVNDSATIFLSLR
jgi:hypothetical protein